MTDQRDMFGWEPPKIPLGPWTVDLAPVWDRIVRAAGLRHTQKLSYASLDQMTAENPHIISLAAQYTVATLAGLEPNEKLLPNGDPVHFETEDGGVAVKGSTWWNPDIKERPEKVGRVDFYVLVKVDLGKKHGIVMGWCRDDQFSRAPMRNFGHGAMRALNWRDLIPGLPPAFHLERL